MKILQKLLNLKEVEKKKKQLNQLNQKLKKKRGRKAAIKYFSSSIRKQMPVINTTVFNDNEDDILHISVKDIIEEQPVDMINGVQENMSDVFNIDENIEINNNEYGEGYYDHNKEISTQEKNIKKGFYNLLSNFKNWNEKTNIKCWWCTYNFTTFPLGCPLDYNQSINKFRVQGIFCSYSCILAYMKENVKDYQNKIYLLKFLYKMLTGSSLSISPAPSRYTLIDYGGHLTIEQFRALSNEAKTYQMIHYPMFMTRDYIGEIDLHSLKQQNTNIFSLKQNSQLLDSKRVEDAKLRISKKSTDTNVKVSNTIEAFLRRN